MDFHGRSWPWDSGVNWGRFALESSREFNWLFERKGPLCVELVGRASFLMCPRWARGLGMFLDLTQLPHMAELEPGFCSPNILTESRFNIEYQAPWIYGYQQTCMFRFMGIPIHRELRGCLQWPRGRCSWLLFRFPGPKRPSFSVFSGVRNAERADLICACLW